MPLAKLQRPPDVANYTYEDGEEVAAIKLDGGASRFRSDILNSASLVSAKWTLAPFGFEYLRAFFNTTLNRGADSFLVDLKIDSAEAVEHTAHFRGPLRHTDLGGGVFEVTAALEVTRNASDADYDGAIVALVNAFGPDQAAIEAGILSLAHLVNVDLPTTELQ